jgi:predicted PurR-regulated permease PerM
VFGVVKVLLNIFVGIIISIYLLAGKEKFIGQTKKLIYTLFDARRGNVIIATARKSNDIFGGFIGGKIVDSLIIGLLCYIGTTILNMPYAVLVSVVVGITNVIPFFGPYIGAIPSFVIIALANPIKGVYFLIFIIILQQLDGNVIGPKILGDSTGLSPFWVVFAILVAGGIFGFVGMLLGVPTFAVIYYIIQELISARLAKKKLPQDTDSYIKAQELDVESNELKY